MDGMGSREEGDKSFKTCDLKVHIHCNGCKKEVKKLLQKVSGIHSISIDAEEGKVTVSGHVDPPTIITVLARNGKHAELLDPTGANSHDHRLRSHAGDGDRERHRMQRTRGLKLPKLKSFMLPFTNRQKYIRLIGPEEREEEFDGGGNGHDLMVDAKNIQIDDEKTVESCDGGGDKLGVLLSWATTTEMGRSPPVPPPTIAAGAGDGL